MKKLHKKLLALVLCVAMCMSLLAGCKSDSGDSDADAGNDVTTFEMPDGPEESDIVVEAIDGLSDDFIRGMDASSVLVEENSGVTYYNYDGEEQDVFMTLAQSGINFIRLRVWNDPYDEDGNGYGGGNNDVATAVELGKRATQYGMEVCIDFHYSDFWADPTRQHCPKAWADMTIDEKCEALYEFTIESMTELLDAGVNVTMVQIGNEINYGMSGETSVPNVMALLEQGSKAIREISEKYDQDIQVAVHYTHIDYESGEVDEAAANLEEYGIDYDVFGLSYYPYWDGTIENMQDVVTRIREGYGKEVMLAETAYVYTDEDGDGFANSFSGAADQLVEGYAATVQSQATMIRDVCAAAYEAGAIGVFYWEGTWIPVGSNYSENFELWEKYGSGWASSYAADYDPEQVGEWYGGSSWDNQAFFDFDGYPLASLNVWKYLKYGSTAELAVDYVPDIYVECGLGEELVLPDTVDAVYNDRSYSGQLAVTWNETQVAAVDTSSGQSCKVTGTVEGDFTITCYITIAMENLVVNPGFEDEDRSMWTVTYEGDENPTDYLNNSGDAHDGDYSFHFWSESDMEFAIEQEFTDLEPGTYQVSAYAQGGDMSSDSDLELYAVTGDGEELTASFMVTTWVDWKNPTITNVTVGDDGYLKIGVRMKCNAGSWGTIDDFALNKIS